MKKKNIYKFLYDEFGPPCDFTFPCCGDVAEFMDDKWCNKHCEKIRKDKCWKKFFKKLNGGK